MLTLLYMPFGQSKSQMCLQKIPKVTPNGVSKPTKINKIQVWIPKVSQVVSLWTTALPKRFSKSPKKTLQVFKMTPQRTEKSVQLEFLMHSNVNTEL